MRINEKPYNRPMAMDYEDSMEWEDTNRYSPAPVIRNTNIKLNTTMKFDVFLNLL